MVDPDADSAARRHVSHAITLDAYGTGVYDRLVDVKTKYDPDNIFHHHQNIRPRSQPLGLNWCEVV